MPLLKKFVQFTGVGAIGTGVQYLLMVALIHLTGIDSVWASSFGFVAGALVNYSLNYIYTFRSHKNHREAMFKFFTVALIGLTLNWMVMVFMVRKIGIHYMLSQVTATGLVLFWNFAGNHFWTFREKTSANQR
jgi:putative flippase GtrA